MVAFPNGKINLGLQVLQKRSDGFHDIATVFYPIGLRDVLEIIPARDIDQPRLHSYGLAIDGDPAGNLCVRAWQLLKNDFPALAATDIHLLKNIPMGAGLGGGSADGAFMLELLNKQFKLNLSHEALLNYALQLGSDCPFFLINQPCLAGGRGEILTVLSFSLTGYTLVCCHPGIHISTAWAFSQLDPYRLQPVAPLNEIIQLPVKDWKNQLVNDFETPVFAQYPAIAEIKDTLYSMGAEYASMSGSGSTIFGLFNNQLTLPTLPAHFTAMAL